ncbi:MAG: NlpC/P60 family protein [Bacteroidota bacterium]|nr:NlpC/P60 family protein [Bacteroidota bacterium]
MKKLTVLCFSIFCAGTLQMANAQTSINKIGTDGNAQAFSPQFINGISFTPDGILRATESGGTKSVKIESSPIVAKTLETVDEKNLSMIEKFSAIQFKYAMILNVDVESLKNLSLFGFIEDWFGTHYHLGGTTKRGIDCSALTGGLLLAVYGFAMPRTARQQYDATEHIKKENLKEGDLVFFNTHGGVSHVGLYLENNYFVHASQSQGVTISSLQDRYYSKRFICGGRVEKD